MAIDSAALEHAVYILFLAVLIIGLTAWAIAGGFTVSWKDTPGTPQWKRIVAACLFLGIVIIVAIVWYHLRF
jgi:hypothetical protein